MYLFPNRRLQGTDFNILSGIGLFLLVATTTATVHSVERPHLGVQAKSI